MADVKEYSFNVLMSYLERFKNTDTSFKVYKQAVGLISILSQVESLIHPDSFMVSPDKGIMLVWSSPSSLFEKFIIYIGVEGDGYYFTSPMITGGYESYFNQMAEGLYKHGDCSKFDFFTGLTELLQWLNNMPFVPMVYYYSDPVETASLQEYKTVITFGDNISNSYLLQTCIDNALQGMVFKNCWSFFPALDKYTSFPVRDFDFKALCCGDFDLLVAKVCQTVADYRKQMDDSVVFDVSGTYLDKGIERARFCL